MSVLSWRQKRLMKHIWKLASQSHCFKVKYVHPKDLTIFQSLIISGFVAKEDASTFRITKDGLWQLQVLHYLDQKKYKNPGKKSIHGAYERYYRFVFALIGAAATKVIEFFVDYFLGLLV